MEIIKDKNIPDNALKLKEVNITVNETRGKAVSVFFGKNPKLSSLQ